MTNTDMKSLARTNTASSAGAPTALGRSAGGVANAIGKAGAKASEPIIRSIQKEEPKTLAKIALAAIAPKLAEGVLRLAMRHKVATLVAVVIMSALALQSDDQQQSA